MVGFARLLLSILPIGLVVTYGYEHRMSTLPAFNTMLLKVPKHGIQRSSFVDRQRLRPLPSVLSERVLERHRVEGIKRIRCVMNGASANAFEEARQAVLSNGCRLLNAARSALGIKPEEKEEDQLKSQAETREQVETFLRQVEDEVRGWVKQMQGMEEHNIAELRSSLDALYEVLSLGSALQWTKPASPMERRGTWRALRKKTDPSTKNLLFAIERLRRRYDKGVRRLTSVAVPLTEEEIKDGFEKALGKKAIKDIEDNLMFVSDTMKPLTSEEVDARLMDLDEKWKYGMHEAEEQLRAGIERVRYHISRKTKRREVEKGAAAIHVRDGTMYASALGGIVEVPILENMGVQAFIDDKDENHIFMGIQGEAEESQHVATLGSIPASATRWLSCARQKLWWMSPDVGDRSMPVPAETQFLLLELGLGMYAVMLPMVGNSFRSSIWGTEGSTLQVRIESGDPDVRTKICPTSVLVAAGTDPFLLLERAFAAAADRLGTFRIRKEKTTPSTLDVFGWCTWDAFYSQVEPEGVKHGLRELAKGGTPSRLLILDDGWQSTDNDEGYRIAEGDAREDVSAAELAGGGVIEGEDWASQQLTSFKDIPARLLTWWYTSVVEKSPYNSMPVKIWKWLTFNVIRNDLLKYFAEATDWSKRLTSINPNSKFVQLGHLVRELKSDFGLQYTFCWHALTGYWLGVDPNAPGMERFQPTIQYPCIDPHFDYTPGMLSTEPTMAWNPSSFVGVGIVPPMHIRDFYGELHKSLHDAGVDGVKCDAQAAITMLGAGYGGGPKITRAYVHAMEQSVKEHLSGNCINCMCHPTENLYSFKDTAIARASDDFYPREPASHTVHVYNVVYNTLFLGEIVHPDWDMFQSEHPAAELHAAARSVGGCAVYTSDRPTVHNFDLLRQLVLPDGSVLRAQLPGRPTRDCLFTDVCKDGVSALKVWNHNQVGGVLGIFNLQGAYWDRTVRNFVMPDHRPPDVVAHVSPQDVERLPSEVGRYAVWSHKREKLFLMDYKSKMDIKLKPQESDVLTVAPIQKLQGVKDDKGDDALWAPVGLKKMFNGGGALLSHRVCGREDHPILQDFLNSVIDPAAMSGGMWNVNRRWKLASAPFSSKFQSNIEVDDEVERFVADPDEEWLWHLNQLTASPLPSLSEKENTMRAHLTVKGQGSLLFYSSARPRKLCAKPLQASSAACEASAEGKKPLATVSEIAGIRGDRAWEEWDFEYKDGELTVELPEMSSEFGSGRWELCFLWEKS
ncbi:hypothetical protein GUITHDRAFT_165320 [Guillardia theta CCMP2712]|uniref:galactinol--sucrose galactosyltransferase n=2 Tax=Guillardia theta TaxID=55529 RepID=L1IQB2_GUITC|nr:hypothetical protein GUITHDRAFT_165320 [Guillardia theta CCMP2712]EKX38074.1 hypothetical protein GUITHDRAFT_165320 [Guillardia theta CCMP2712]|eukprot:XP_005825054.1 hypothetical protein GUITHDRAFT_165320 [Guillardia theta CCMP2712]